MAEGIFKSLVSKPPYQSLIGEVDSCGTGACKLCPHSSECAKVVDPPVQIIANTLIDHTGSSPDSRTMSTLKDNGITDYKHAARKVF